MLREPGLQSMQYLLDVCVFNEAVPLKDENIAVLAAMVGEPGGRSDFLSALHKAGVDQIGDRQMFANCLVRGVREGNISRGWDKPPPETCSHCAALPAKGKKLLTCGRCKTAKYCSAACQKAAWGAGHKGVCKAPDKTKAAEWQEVRDGEAENFGGAGPVAWKKEVSTGGWGGHPVLGAKGEVVDHRE